MDKNIHSPPANNKHFFMTQSLLRVLAIGTTLAAGIVIMFNSKQSVVVYGIEFDARYSYSPAFKFFAFANIASFVVSFATLFVSLIYGLTAVGSLYYFYLFVNDLGVTVLLVAGCAAATAIGYVGKYGNTHTGWTPICDHFGKFCNKVITSAVLSYFGLICSFVLTISSVNRIRHVQA